MQRKIQRAARALKNKLEAEKKARETAEKKAKAAREEEAKASAAAAKKALKEQQKSTAQQAKKAASNMPKRIKALPKVKALVQVSTRRSVVVPDPGVVAMVVGARKTATRTINLLQRFM